jgi:hypothetical protein
MKESGFCFEGINHKGKEVGKGLASFEFLTLEIREKLQTQRKGIPN